MSIDLDSVEELVSQSERALSSGDLGRACTLLEEAAGRRLNDPDLWLRVAALHRGSGKPRLALNAVHEALKSAPLNFTALLMRASLLEKLGDPLAGEAWGHALAQKPSGELPPQILQAVTLGEQRHSEWIASRMRRLKDGMSDLDARASPEERKRIERFRDNVLRLKKPFHSKPTHYHFPELAEREFHPRSFFPWMDELESMTDTIATEFATVVKAEHAELEPYVQYEDHLPLDQWRDLNRNPDWTAIHLRRNGEIVEANARHCPETMAFLEKIPQPAISGAGPNAMFSLLAPHTAIPPHVGVNNARLVCHLPLIVPEGCWFRVGAETRYWTRGEAFAFDDTIEHEALNPSDELRVVLIFDVWNPALTAVEREAVKTLIEVDGAGTPKPI